MITFRKVIKLKGKKGYQVVKEKVKEKKKKGLTPQFLSVSTVVVELGFVIWIAIAGGAILGTYLDKKFNLAPRMTLSFIFLGVFLATYNLYRIVKTSFQKKIE